MKRLLITGSRGFIAGALLNELKSRRPKARILCLDRLPAAGHLACDLKDAASMRRLVRKIRPAQVFHLAGSHQSLAWNELWDIHVLATMNLLEALNGLPQPPRVVIAGSSAEYGLPSARGPVGEGSETRPLSPYGATKR